MTPYNRILELNSQGMNHSAIAATIGSISRKTVITALQLADKAGLQYPITPPMTDTDIHHLLHPKKNQAARMPDMDEVMFLLSLPDQSIAKIWKSYQKFCIQHDLQPYSKSMFQNYVLERRKRGDIGVYEPGMDIFCVKNAAPGMDGKKRTIIFGMMRSSNFVCAVIVNERGTRGWIHAIIRLLHKVQFAPPTCSFISHLPKRIEAETIDCLKYYGIEVEHTKNKNDSLYVFSQKAISALNCSSDQTANETAAMQLSDICAEYNNVPLVGAEAFTRQKAHTDEGPFLLPLPHKDYDLVEYQPVEVRYYHIEIDGMYYSVPFEFRHDKLMAYISDRYIEILSGDTTICVHNRINGQHGRYSTDPDHIPNENRIPWDEVSGRSLRKWAEKIGPYTLKTIDYWLRSRTYEVQAYRICDTILHLSSTYGKERLEAACQHAWIGEQVSYSFITDELKSISHRPEVK